MFVEEKVNWIKLGLFHFLLVSLATFGSKFTLGFLVNFLFFYSLKAVSGFTDADTSALLTKGVNLVTLFIWYFAIRYSARRFLQPAATATTYREIAVLPALLWALTSAFIILYFRYGNILLAILGAVISGFLFFAVTKGVLVSDDRSFRLTR